MIRRRVLALAVPYVAQSLLDTLMFYVDMFMIGDLGRDAMASMGIAGPISYTLTLLLGALGVGTIATVGRMVGAQDAPGKERAAATALVVAAALGAAGSAIGFFLLPRATWVFAPPDKPEIASLAAGYIQITTGAMFFMLVQIVSARIMIAAGNSRVPMMIGAIENLVNGVLDYVLIYGKLGFPAYGVWGAGLATAIAYVIAATVAFAYLFTRRSPLRLRVASFGSVTRESMATFFRVTLPACVEPLVMQSGFLVYSKVITLLGVAQLAAHRVAITIESLTFMPGNAIAGACAALTAQALGAKRPDHAVRSFHESSRLALYFMSSIGLLFVITPLTFTRLFSPADEIVAYQAALLITITAFSQPFFSQAITLAGALRGAGDTKSPVVVAFVGVWLVRVPLAYVLAFPAGLGVNGIWLTMIADWFMRMSVYLILFRRGRWKEIRL